MGSPLPTIYTAFRLGLLRLIRAGPLGIAGGGSCNAHWSLTASLKRRFPGTTVESESLYVQDGKVWTSGGVTSGIDMCLAMVEEDVDQAKLTDRFRFPHL